MYSFAQACLLLGTVAEMNDVAHGPLVLISFLISLAGSPQISTSLLPSGFDLPARTADEV